MKKCKKRSIFNGLKLSIILSFVLLILASCNQKSELDEVHKHTKVHVYGIEPSCISEGRLEYWYCSQCNKIYKDQAAQIEISIEDTRLPKTEHIVTTKSAVDPTCEHFGLTEGTYCSYCEAVLTPQENIPALGHAYNFEQGVWNWEKLDSAYYVVSCNNDANHQFIYAASITEERTEPTCMDAGKIVYTAQVEVNGKVYTRLKEKILLPLEHEYNLEDIKWEWDQNHHAKAVITCNHNGTHQLEFNAEVQKKVINSTCTTTGIKSYIATIVVNDETYQDISEVEIPELGHNYNYNNIQWVWEAANDVKAVVLCKHNPTHTLCYTAEIKEEIEPSTCLTKGLKSYIATIVVDNETYQDIHKEVIPELGHDFDYSNIEWVWEGVEDVEAVVSCKYDSTHTLSYAAEIKEEIEPSTCLTKGLKSYIATIVVDNETYQDIFEVEIPELGHDFDYSNIEWVWEGVEDVEAVVSCKYDSTHTLSHTAEIKEEIEPSTCLTKGLKSYIATIVVDDETYQDISEVEIPELGHDFDYSNIEWVWEGVEDVEAVVSCKHDSTHTLSHTAEIKEEIEPSTCLTKGLKSYIATIVVDNETYQDIHKEVIPELGHDFDYSQPIWIWNTYTTATLSFACRNDSSHFDTYPAQITSETIFSSCVTEGKITYIASVDLEWENYSDQKIQVLPLDPEHHEYDYAHPTWQWSPIVEGYEVTLLIDCKCKESQLKQIAEDVNKKEELATFQKEGYIEYKVELILDNQTYYDTLTEELPIKKYIKTSNEFIDAIEQEAYDLTMIDDIVLTKGALLKGNFAAIDLNGFTLTMPNSSLSLMATHTTIKNGYLVAGLDQLIDSYAVSIEDKANVLIDSVSTFGGINICNANAKLINVDVTATLEYALSAKEGAHVALEGGIYKKTFDNEKTNALFYIEAGRVENGIKYQESDVFVREDVKFYTTTQATLYTTLGVGPKSEAALEVSYINPKDYLKSDAIFKCLSLGEDLELGVEEDSLSITGKRLVLDLKEHKLTVFDRSLKISTSLAYVSGGFIELYEASKGVVLIFEDGSNAEVKDIKTNGSIQTINSTVILTNVLIYTADSQNE